MKSGNLKKIKINLKKFEDAHLDSDCNGHFEFGCAINGFYDGTALGPIVVPCLPMVECNKCGAVQYIPEFNEFLDQIIAAKLVSSKGLLNKRQIKFLRQHFGLTQEEFGKLLSTDKYEISKMESLKSTRVMQPEKQIVMKIKFAKLLKIKRAEVLYDIADPTDEEIKIQPDWFPCEEDVREFLKKKVG